MTAEEVQASQPTTENAEGGEKKPEKVDVKNLQNKFSNLLDQRDEYNGLARTAADERNLLNEQRRAKSDEIESLKNARDALNEKMREHKEKRNAYQDQAKALIGEKRGKTGSIERSLPLRVRKLRNELQDSVQTQQTATLSPAKEKVLVEKIRDMWLELKELEKELEKQQTVEVDLSDTDQAIDSLFSKADAEHEEVKRFTKEAQAEHEKFVAAVKEVRGLVAESNKHHQEFVAFKTKADECHNKAMELREQVAAVRGEIRADRQRQRKEVSDYNKQVRRNVMDEKAIQKAKDASLDDLKKGGKIQLGGW